MVVELTFFKLWVKCFVSRDTETTARITKRSVQSLFIYSLLFLYISTLKPVSKGIGLPVAVLT